VLNPEQYRAHKRRAEMQGSNEKTGDNRELIIAKTQEEQ